LIHQSAQQTAAALPGLLIEAERIADAVIHGIHGRRRAGPGEDFWQYRPYASGDAVGRIAWRRSARQNRLFVRENEWAATNTLWTFVASDAGMHFKSDLATVTKHHRAAVLAMALSILAVKAGERVATIGAPVNPGHTASTLNQMAHWLETSKTGSPLPQTQTRTIPKNASIVLLGDFLKPLEEVRQSFQALATRGASGHVVQIIDPVEETFPFTGRTQFLDTLTTKKFIAGRAETLREQYRKKFSAHQTGLMQIVKPLGWHFTTHHTDKPTSAVLLRLYHLISGHAPALQTAQAGI